MVDGQKAQTLHGARIEQNAKIFRSHLQNPSETGDAASDNQTVLRHGHASVEQDGCSPLLVGVGDCAPQARSCGRSQRYGHCHRLDGRRCSTVVSDVSVALWPSRPATTATMITECLQLHGALKPPFTAFVWKAQDRPKTQKSCRLSSH